jgi:hypothetical protein
VGIPACRQAGFSASRWREIFTNEQDTNNIFYYLWFIDKKTSKLLQLIYPIFILLGKINEEREPGFKIPETEKREQI